MPLIAMAGLPGSGKTTLAKTFVQSINPDKFEGVRNKVPVIFNKDTIRNVLFPPDLIDYSSDQDDFCMDIMLRCSQYLFSKNPQHIIILDGRTFTCDYQVQIVKKTALSMGVTLFWIECVCDPVTAKQRIMHDKKNGLHPAANRDAVLYDKVKASAEPLSVPHLVVDTTQPISVCVGQVIHYVFANG